MTEPVRVALIYSLPHVLVGIGCILFIAPAHVATGARTRSENNLLDDFVGMHEDRGRIATPMLTATLLLMAISKRVGCSKGISAGWPPVADVPGQA
jgi:hypothetical protein